MDATTRTIGRQFKRDSRTKNGARSNALTNYYKRSSHCFSCSFYGTYVKREPTLDTIVLSQQAGSAFSEIIISKTLSKNIGEKSSELLNRQTSIVISYQQKKKLRLISPSPKATRPPTTSGYDD